MSDGHCFISYSNIDGLDFATKLANDLEGGYPFIKVWFEKQEMIADKDDWDDQLAKAIQQCKCLLYVMSQDSTAEHTNCKDEWTWALKFKKPVVCLWIDNKAEDQFRLNSRQKIDFTQNFDAGLARLRKSIAHLDSPEGQLEELHHRLADANRDLRRASEERKPLIQADIDELKKQIEAQEKVAENPEAAKRLTEQNIQNGLERERKPQLPVASFQSSKFINQPPGVAQNYFQDRLMETEQAILFLKNEAQRVLTVVGRGGAGKTAMTCRLLKFVENGGLPDDFERKHGRVEVDGIVYLSEAGSRKVNFANLFEDLCKLLPAASAEKLSALYREPQTSTESKTVQLLAAFQGLKQVIVLLDNFENVVDAEKGQVRDAELDEALRAFLHAPHHPVKVIITTRVSARELDTFEPARQRLLPLDTGLQPEYAREAFVLMDEGNLVGIKNAGAELLNLAVTRTLGLPRALEALYAALRTDRFTTLRELLDLPILPEQVVQAYVGEAFNRLDTNAQKVMQALAVYNRPVTSAAVDHLLAPHLPAIDSAPILQRLANMHFARKESGRFYLHPVDREFAFGLIPVEDLTAKTAKENQKESLRSLRASRFDAFTQHDLTSRAADYFKQARKPRAEWKKLDDLSAQLAEFDLRCAAGDYDTAASVLREIGFDYLLLWGHYRPALGLYDKVYKNINDYYLRENITGNMGTTFYYMAQYQNALHYHSVALKMAEEMGDKANQAVWVNWVGNSFSGLGQSHEAITKYELSLRLAEEIGDRKSKGIALSNLGDRYAYFGEINKAIEFYEQALVIAREIRYQRGEGYRLGSLGNCCANLGKVNNAIKFYEQALVIAREIGDKRSEGAWLSSLGNRYTELDNNHQGFEFQDKSLSIRREIGDRKGESFNLDNMGHVFINLEEHPKAQENYQQAIQIADEISYPPVQQNARNGLAENYLFQNDLVNARATIETALQYDVPQNNHNVSALHGIIALRQGDEVAARGAFVRAIGQADEILSKTAEYYSALDAKGLAICGLLICDLRFSIDGRGDPSMPTKTNDGKTVPPDKVTVSAGRVAPTVADAIETFQKARKIAPHAGVVKRVLRLFDELVKCDPEGVLKEVRAAVEGKE